MLGEEGAKNTYQRSFLGVTQNAKIQHMIKAYFLQASINQENTLDDLYILGESFPVPLGKAKLHLLKDSSFFSVEYFIALLWYYYSNIISTKFIEQN